MQVQNQANTQPIIISQLPNQQQTILQMTQSPTAGVFLNQNINDE